MREGSGKKDTVKVLLSISETAWSARGMMGSTAEWEGEEENEGIPTGSSGLDIDCTIFYMGCACNYGSQ
jgi:hypothetical protein